MTAPKRTVIYGSVNEEDTSTPLPQSIANFYGVPGASVVPEPIPPIPCTSPGLCNDLNMVYGSMPNLHAGITSYNNWHSPLFGEQESPWGYQPPMVSNTAGCHIDFSSDSYIGPIYFKNYNAQYGRQELDFGSTPPPAHVDTMCTAKLNGPEYSGDFFNDLILQDPPPSSGFSHTYSSEDHATYKNIPVVAMRKIPEDNVIVALDSPKPGRLKKNSIPKGKRSPKTSGFKTASCRISKPRKEKRRRTDEEKKTTKRLISIGGACTPCKNGHRRVCQTLLSRWCKPAGLLISSFSVTQLT